MTTIDEMDELVNWDNADMNMDSLLSSGDLDIDPMLVGMNPEPSADNIDLVLQSVDEDDWGFSALQHFSDSNALTTNLESFAGQTAVQQQPGSQLEQGGLYWVTPDFPCSGCALGNYSCKKISEGIFKGYCTSCVALGVECSFGAPVPDNLNPLQASKSTAPDFWSSMGNPLETIPKESQAPGSLRSATATPNHDNSTSANASDSEAAQQSAATTAPPKIGARFSRESVRILKNWLTTHNRHPYPSDEEKELLQRKTGLNKTQITNWLANARRRGKVQPPRATSPAVGKWASGSGSMDIPRRPGTPAFESMNPLQRWQNSPPEHEPASVTAIARAVTASSDVSSGISSPWSRSYDDGSNRSICNQSSASSLGTSHSSTGSAYSHGSRNSWGSFGSAPFNSRNRRRRRRRAGPTKGPDGKMELNVPLKTFQCTFCTETFRTKHDWQRHEKSLHLSLERWVCAPKGPKAVNPDTGVMSCVFCGEANPDDTHIESHNHSTCQERSPEERTFYRKDHLNQHMRLVHNVKFMNWSMKDWRAASPEIRSRCGFCGIVMDTWSIRVDHLAEHFKTGKSMADWKGDWGFDGPVLDMVENSIPPYLIHHERTSPLPYIASHSSPESPRNAYELIKLELAYFTVNYQDQHGRPPTDEEMAIEGCRIIFASELLSLQGIATQQSWLRDLIMSDDELSKMARFGPIRAGTENRLATLKINGKDNLFEQCPMEFQLHEFVRAKRLLGLTAMDNELQEEACRIVGRVEETSTHPSDVVANWLLRTLTKSTLWLSNFRRRAHLPRSEDVQDMIIRSTDPTSIDSTIHSYSRLERELADFLKLQRATGHEPLDEDLQRQARIIIYEFDDGWNQTAADNISWLTAFKDRHPPEGSPEATTTSPANSATRTAPTTITASTFPSSGCPAVGNALDPVGPGQTHIKTSPFFLNDANCYRRLAKELGRWVAMTMSPNNPNSHIPNDAELQHQARWILYDDDDPWNQTAADNAEWLQRFKRDNGIIKTGGPGLGEGRSWAISDGGPGLAPPFAFPRSPPKPFSSDVPVPVNADDHPGRSFNARQNAVNNFLEGLAYAGPNERPPAVFCVRELEQGLVQTWETCVRETGRVPQDEVLKCRAREICRANKTAADDPVLLQKFQEYMLQKHGIPAKQQQQPQQQAEQEISVLPSNMQLNISDEEIGHMLQDMDMDLGLECLEGRQDTGGVSLTGFKD